MIRRASLSMLAIAMLAMFAVGAAPATGNLKLDVLGEDGAGAKNEAEVIAPDGKVIAKVAPGATVALPPGTYKLHLPIIGGSIDKDDVAIDAGRTHTVLINNVAVLGVSVKDRDGKDPGFGVTVSGSDPPHNKITSFVSGDKVLCAPAMVDVKVDAPPQGYNWSGVKLIPGHHAQLTLDEVQKGQLTIQSVLGREPIDNSTRVTIYRKGTQKQVAISQPGAAHRFMLDPGDYDVYVENNSGKGRPYTTLNGVHLDPGAKVERTVPLEDEKK